MDIEHGAATAIDNPQIDKLHNYITVPEAPSPVSKEPSSYNFTYFIYLNVLPITTANYNNTTTANYNNTITANYNYINYHYITVP